MSTRVIYDVTLEVSESMIIYPGDPEVEIKEHMSIKKGDSANVSKLSLGSHTGTHIDAPRHFMDNGTAIDALPFEHLIGRAKVFEIMDTDAVTYDDIKDLGIEKGDIVLFKTRNSSIIIRKKFENNFVYISPDAAKYLSKVGIRTVGIDYFSVEKYDSSDFQTHCSLLGSGIVIIEGLDLRGIKPGVYDICALPLKIKGGDGSPARVLLFENM